MPELIKMRVLNRYRGTESDQFADGAVPEGAIISVSPERSRQLIANGNAVPIVGASAVKPAGPSEQPGNDVDGKGGPAEPSQSSQAAPVLPASTVQKLPAAKKGRRGGASR